MESEEKTEEKTQEKLSIVLRVAFGMGNMLNVLGVVGMWFPYALGFFTKVLLIPHTQAATIVLVAQVAGGVFTPLVGMLSDMCKCRGPIYGRRKIFHLFGVIAFVCSFFFIWHDCFGCRLNWAPKYTTLYYSILTVVFQFGYAATQIPQLAMVPELASNKHMKVELNSIRFAFQVAGTLIVFVLLWILIAKLPGSYNPHLPNDTQANCSDNASQLNPKDAKAFWVLAIIVIGLGFLMIIPFHIVVREKNTVLNKLKWYKWLIKPDFYLVICAFVASKIITIFTQQYLPFFFLDTLKMNETSISVGPLILYIGSFIATIAVKRINKIVGEKMLYFLGTVLVWGALMWFWVQPEHGDHELSNFYWKRDCIYIGILLLGMGGATLMVLSLSMVSILIGDFSGSSAFVCGWVLFADRVSNGVLNKLVLELKPKNNGCTMQENLRDAAFYRHVIVYTPFAATVLGLASICLLALYQYWKRRGMLQAVTTSDQARANIQISNTVADRASLYSFKISAAICCSKCRESATLDQPSAAIDEEERRSLVESYREELMTSSVHKPLQENDLEISLAT